MKGNTQLHAAGDVVVVGPADVDGAVVVVVVVVVVLVDVVGAAVDSSAQAADSSPTAAKRNLISVMTAALLETPATPVGVPVCGRITLGLE